MRDCLTLHQSKLMPDAPRWYCFSLNGSSCPYSGATPSLATLAAVPARYLLTVGAVC